MNANSLPISDTDSATHSEHTMKKSNSVFSEVITLLTWFLVTSAISLALTLSWVL